jgi:pyruvate ferredoxin oxidoreductase alpha subunit
MNKKEVPLTGAHAFAEAMRQLDPDVVAVYPLTPQSPMAQKFSSFVADGKVNTELIRVESEHSAMSACIGAAAAGARVMTATASVGLALMWEVVAVASSMRLPIVMGIGNRAISGPINIHCDHSDSMGTRDLSWIQIYSETPQEAYDHTILAMKLAEHPAVILPAMVMQDGFITTHCVTQVNILDDRIVRNFVGRRKPQYVLLDTSNPMTFGPLQLQNSYFETKHEQVVAMENAKKVFLKVGRDLSRITGNRYGYFDAYRLNDATHVIVTLASTAGTVKVVVDELRKKGKKVGLLKLRLFRPFPYAEVARALANAKMIAVMDRSASFGAEPPLMSEVKSALFDNKKRPKLQSIIFGLGGREIFEEDILAIFKDLLSGKITKTKYVGLKNGR